MKTISSENEKRPVSRAVFILIGLLLVLDTLFVMTRSSLTFGVLMPALIGMPLMIIGLLMPFFRSLCRRSRIFSVFAFLLSLAYAVFGLVFALTTALILINSSAPASGADALIVLGGGIRGSSPTLTLKYRLDAAAEYLEDNPDCLAVVSGGQGYDEICPEAEVMKNYLVSRGIAADRIIEESRSLSTAENFEFSGRIIRDRLGEDAVIVFVTTRFHVFRAERVAKKLGVDAEGIPAKGVWYITPNDYLRECAAIVLYFLRGDI